MATHRSENDLIYISSDVVAMHAIGAAGGTEAGGVNLENG
jgi:hypothetical protein